MISTFTGTTARELQTAITEARRNVGSASGMVFTLVVLTDLHAYTSVMAACVEAGREHPSRVLLVTDGTAKADRLDAELHLGEDVPGEILSLRFQGELAEHKASVVLPLLLPDSPVIAWWPSSAPVSLADDSLGHLATRRITDAMGTQDPLGALAIRAANMSPGDTDLTWTRLTPWRALLTASLDQFPVTVSRVTVKAAADNAAGLLLAAWLDDRLGCEVVIEPSAGPGITAVVMSTPEGDISVTRGDGRMATFSAPRTPRRQVALRRRPISALITEELRRMDADDILQSAMARLLVRQGADRARAVRESDPARILWAAEGTQVE